MITPFQTNFPRKPIHEDEVVIKFKLTDSATKASFNFCTAEGKNAERETQKTHQLEISFTDGKETLKHILYNGSTKIMEQQLEKSIITNRKEFYTLVFCLFDKGSQHVIKVFFENTQHTQDIEMTLEDVALDEIHYVELKDDFQYVKAVMFRLNDAPPATETKQVYSDEFQKCKTHFEGVCLCECAWCACCAKDKPK